MYLLWSHVQDPQKAHEIWGNGVACVQEKLIPCTNNHVKCKRFDTPYGKGWQRVIWVVIYLLHLVPKQPLGLGNYQYYSFQISLMLHKKNFLCKTKSFKNFLWRIDCFYQFGASVACILAPIVNTFIFFTFSELRFSKFSNVNILMAQQIFSSKPNFSNFIEFSATKYTQKSISSTLGLWKLWNKLH